jgi:hypothetical protein
MRRVAAAVIVLSVTHAARAAPRLSAPIAGWVELHRLGGLVVRDFSGIGSTAAVTWDGRGTKGRPRGAAATLSP